MFGLTDAAVVHSLRQSIRKGVSTTIYYDPTGSSQLRGKLRGADLHPIQQSGLMHQKILILDRELVFLGSANMTASSLRMHDNLVVGVRSPALAQFLLAHPPYTPGYLRTMIGGQELELWLLPDPRGNIVGELRRLIRNASRSVKIALFTFTHPALCEELIAAKRRGIAVTLVVDSHSGLGASAKAVEQLRMGGVPVFLSQGLQLLHHKFLLVDDQMLVCGSANWTKAALTKNSDCILILHQLTQEQKQFMKRLWNKISTEAVQKKS
jgi:cardiolipin synthase A/B